MKIMQVNCTYRAGSTGKIMYDIHTHLKENGHESVMCYGRGENTADGDVYRLCSNLYAKGQNLRSRLTGVMYGGCLLSTRKLIGIIRKEKPDIVHLHCINGYFVNIYKLLTWLKTNGVKTVLTLHAEFMYTANCGHAFDCDKWQKGCGGCPRLREETKSLFLDRTATSWKRMLEAFSGFDNNLTVVSVSPWLMQRAKSAPILAPFTHKCIFNGLDTAVFCPQDAKDVRNTYAPKGQKLVLFVTALFANEQNHPKGGQYLVELAKRMPTVKFLVAGKYLPCTDLPQNIVMLGNVSDQNTLAKLYTAADLSLILSKRETFSMPVAESLCCGTPVVGFCAGAPEQITLKEYSCFVPYGDTDALETTVADFLSKSFNANDMAMAAAKTYAAKNMAKSYTNVYGEMYESQ